MFKKIKPKKISDEIVEQIKDLILQGKLKPGDKLPPERELASTMGVSRPVIREAISKLVAMGYLENRWSKGTFVLPITEGGFEEKPILDFLKKGIEALPEIVEVRKILETWAAATAALRATEEEIQQMREYLEEMEEAKNRGEIGYIADANFHSAISYATHNTLLIHIMNNIYQMIEKVSFEVRSRMYKDPQSHEDLYRQHKAIFDAIVERNSEKAYKAMMEHMKYIEKEVAKILKEEKKDYDYERPIYPFKD